jgi:hypothetical protein
LVNEELRRRALPEHDDHDLEGGPREDPVEAREELTLAEARWILKVALSLVLVAGVVAFSGIGTVSKHLREDVLGALQQVRDSSTAAIRSAVGDSVSAVGDSVSAVGDSVSSLGAIAGDVGAVPIALGADVVGALQQARDSSTAALRSAVGQSAPQQVQNISHEPFQQQYHSSVFVCLPNVDQGQVVNYVTSNVSAHSVPSLVSGGAIYPVPAGGCS